MMEDSKAVERVNNLRSDSLSCLATVFLLIGKDVQ